LLYCIPFNPATTIRFDLPAPSRVRAEVFDLAGRRVAQLLDDWRDAGSHAVTFDGSALAAGMYLCRMQAGEYTGVVKMLLVK